MSSNVYSLRIFASGALTNAAGTVGPIVPANFVYVVRDIEAFDSSNSAADELVVFSPVAGVLLNITGPQEAPFGAHMWRGRQVYGPGEQVGFHAFVGTWSVTCSGYQLTLP